MRPLDTRDLAFWLLVAVLVIAQTGCATLPHETKTRETCRVAVGWIMGTVGGVLGALAGPQVAPHICPVEQEPGPIRTSTPALA